MNINAYLNNLDNGVYRIPPRPKTNLNNEIDWYKTKDEISQQVPEIINENRTIVWNRRKREEIINEKLAYLLQQEKTDINHWLEKERDIITKQYDDLMEVFIEEFQLSKNQVEYIISKIWDTSIVDLDIECIEEFEELKIVVENIKNFSNIK